MSSLMTCQAIASPTEKTKKQVVLWIGANSGGVSKTTTAIHLGYEMARRGFNVALIDIDTNVSMNKFCGLPLQIPAERTMAKVFDSDFDGNYPLLTPPWGNPKGQLQVCLGGGIYMVEVSLQLGSRVRREYALADTLTDRPLSHDLVIIDCPASLGTLSDVALAAATHILLPMDVTSKTLTGSDVLLNWIRQTVRSLRLIPPPQILGVLPTLYDKNEWAQRELLSTLPTTLEKQKIHCYNPVRYTSEFKNASIEGVPLQIYRPKHAAVKEFFPVCNDLQAIICGEP